MHINAVQIQYMEMFYVSFMSVSSGGSDQITKVPMPTSPGHEHENHRLDAHQTWVQIY